MTPATQALKAALTPHMTDALHAEEAARNIAQVLDTWEEGDPTPKTIIADALWARRQHVRHLVEAAHRATTAWVLAQCEPHERLELLTDIGHREQSARELLATLGLGARC